MACTSDDDSGCESEWKRVGGGRSDGEAGEPPVDEDTYDDVEDSVDDEDAVDEDDWFAGHRAAPSEPSALTAPAAP